MNSAPTKSNRGHATWIVLVLALAAVAATHGDRQPVDWRTRLANELPLLGHRNWIVIADAPRQRRRQRSRVGSIGRGDLEEQVLEDDVHLRQ